MRSIRRFPALLAIFAAPLLPNLTWADAPASPETLARGRELFERVWTPGDSRSHGGDGLGPVFNARSCLDCHNLGGTGGAGAFERNVDIATASGIQPNSNFGFIGYSFAMRTGPDGTFEYRASTSPPPRAEPRLDPVALAQIHRGFSSSKSVMLHHLGTDPAYLAWREKVVGDHGPIRVTVTQRNPTPLFGMGLIDAIPDSAIEAAARKRFPGFAQVKGRVSRLPNGRIGRFGWKAQAATLSDFVRSAAAFELGLQVPGFDQAADPRIPRLDPPGLDMSAEEVEALTAYTRELPAPTVREIDGRRDSLAIRDGKSIFKSVGCATCHAPKMGTVDGIYSDLLLHDMTPPPNSTNPYAAFLPRELQQQQPQDRARLQPGETLPLEWRTPPLWGLRESAPYWHDGRAGTIDEAIRLHDGQGAASSERYVQLPARDKQLLETFLLSLIAPHPGG